MGVALDSGVGLALAVALGVIVAFGVTLGLAVRVALAVAERVLLGLGVRVALGLGERLGVTLGLGVRVAFGDGVRLALAGGVIVAVTVGHTWRAWTAISGRKLTRDNSPGVGDAATRADSHANGTALISPSGSARAVVYSVGGAPTAVRSPHRAVAKADETNSSVKPRNQANGLYVI